MSFSHLGHEKAELEIQQQQEALPQSIYSEIKPFTTKAPSHVIEALDIVSEDFGMSRNAFVLKLIESYLGSAFVDYNNAYGAAFNEDPHTFPVSQLENLINKSNPSPEARQFLERTIFSSMGIPNNWSNQND